MVAFLPLAACLPDDIRYHLIVPLPESQCGHRPKTRHSVVKKEVVLAELTICYETNHVEAREWKTSKYLGLVEEVEEGGFCATILPLQMGSRGMVEVKGFERLWPHLSDSHHR